MSEYLAAAAENMGMPESLVMRSATAKAKAQGVTVEDLLREWAGGEAASASASASASAKPDEAPVAAAAPPPAAVPAPAPVAAGPGEIRYEYETLPTPETVTPDEALEWEQVTTIKASGITERTRATLPGWLMAVLVLVPVLAVAFLLTNTEGLDCGEGGLLASDFAGTLTNCDLTAYAPGGGGGEAQLLAASFEGGLEAFSACAACHGSSGEGGVGPELAGVVETFPACTDQVEWIALGSAGWPDATYGATAKPVNGGMPGFAASLSTDEIADLALYIRVQFAGQDMAETGTDCGLTGGTSDEAPEPVEGEHALGS